MTATVKGSDLTVSENRSIPVSPDILISNLGTDAITYYAVWNAGGGSGGYFTLNGAIEPANSWIVVSSQDILSLDYVGGSSTGIQTLYVDAYDGTTKQWTPYSQFTATTIVPVGPSVTAQNLTVNQDQADFFGHSNITLFNPSGDNITQYAFMDAGGGRGGHLAIGNTIEAAGQWLDVNAFFGLGQVRYVGGSNTGNQTLYVKAYDATTGTWTAATKFTATTTPSSMLSELQNSGVRTDVGNLMVSQSLSYQSMMKILDDAAVGGMTATKFSTLKTLASLLNIAGGISTSSYVQQITDDVIYGDPANAYWTGGAATHVGLGNLSSTSTQTQVDKLIGKWFLGTDLPSTNLSAVGGSGKSQYLPDTASLFGTTSTPNYLDVNQGNVGDCWFVSTLAEVALQNPSAIESMITSNGNGTYELRFYLGGKPEYITVNDYLPTWTSPWTNGSTLEFANDPNNSPIWAELIEKGFAQLNAEPSAIHGQTGVSANAYEGIAGGYPQNALAELTGQSSVTYRGSQLVTDASIIGSAFESGEEAELCTPQFYNGSTPVEFNGDLVSLHCFEVIGYDPTTQTFTLHNPWGSAVNPVNSPPVTFAMTASALAADDCTMAAAQGASIKLALYKQGRPLLTSTDSATQAMLSPAASSVTVDIHPAVAGTTQLVQAMASFGGAASNFASTSTSHQDLSSQKDFLAPPSHH
jgi:hypothetical protein